MSLTTAIILIWVSIVGGISIWINRKTAPLKEIFHIHRYHLVRQRIPPYSEPEPSNPFELEIWVRRCRCGKTKGGY